MRRCATPFKWLLIGLLVVSFAGRPWAQALPASGCGGSTSAVAEHADTAATDEAGTITASETAASQHESGQTKSANCVKSCTAVPVLAISADPSWSFEVWPQIHETAVEVILHGLAPEPELFPPIALV